MNGFSVLKPGVLSLLQDNGRIGQQHLGLSNGGPADPLAFSWANRLLNNSDSATVVEVSVGGLELQARVRTVFCVCGADMPLTLNNEARALWQSHVVHPGDVIKLGYAKHGLRAYLAVSGGFAVKPQFGSTATVVREQVGGIDGFALNTGSWLPCATSDSNRLYRTADIALPDYSGDLTVHLVPGYQYAEFSKTAIQLLLHSKFTVGDRSDRMAYQLNGPQIDAPKEGIASEGNCLGAVQIPPDGQPYVLLNDRQTIGGYPKPGSILSTDCAQLAQRRPGSIVRFRMISVGNAQRLLLEHAIRFEESLQKMV